jgi:competence protein ComEA
LKRLDMALDRSEKILIGIGCLMGAFMILFNVFFIPEVPILRQENYIQNESNVQISESETNREHKVNINNATTDELSEKLSGIGPKIAERIIDYREKNGGFLEIEELKNVRGIGNILFDRIKNDITV